MPAIELYQGALRGIINACNIDVVRQSFEVFFLSAKYGLISGEKVIEPYDTRISKDNSAQVEFALQHKAEAQRVLSKYIDKTVSVFTVFSKDYQNTFDLMNLPALNKAAFVYHARINRGIGDQRGILKKVLLSVIDTHSPPIHFRSGCVNLPEFNGYRTAGESIGTSLAYIKRKGVMAHVIDAIKTKTHVFLDNGLITAVTKGYDLSEQSVFDQYCDLVKSIRGTQSLSIVVPDDPFSQDKALATIKRFKKEIKWLATQCQVIIPFHKPIERSVKEQLKLVTDILGKSTFTVGIPCRSVKDNDWRLSLLDIESLFRAKRADGSQVITRAHFLALSEHTRGTAYAERRALCAMYAVGFQADACRTTALFGHTNSNRAGSVMAREYAPEAVELNTKKSSQYLTFDNKALRQAMYKQLLALLDQHSSMAVFWNEHFPDSAIEGAGHDFDADIKAIFLFEELLTQRMVKESRWHQFTLPEHIPNNSEVRAEAIVRLFIDDLTDRTPVQQVIGF